MQISIGVVCLGYRLCVFHACNHITCSNSLLAGMLHASHVSRVSPFLENQVKYFPLNRINLQFMIIRTTIILYEVQARQLKQS